MSRTIGKTASLALAAGVVTFAIAWAFPPRPMYADPECSGCSWLQDTGFVTHDCIGRANRGPASCSWGSINQPCVLTGVATWYPLPNAQSTCAVNSPTGGVIMPLGTSNNAQFFFNPVTDTSRVYAYATTSNCVVQQTFGWQMYVVHTRQASQPCDCSGSQQLQLVGSTYWNCGG